MVWEQGSATIIMLTNLEEKGRVRMTGTGSDHNTHNPLNLNMQLHSLYLVLPSYVWRALTSLMPFAFIVCPTIVLSPEVSPALALPHNICVSETYDSSLSGGLVTYFHMSPAYVIALQPCVIASLAKSISAGSGLQ